MSELPAPTSHRPQVAIEPLQGALDELVPRRDVVGLEEQQVLVLRRRRLIEGRSHFGEDTRRRLGREHDRRDLGFLVAAADADEVERARSSIAAMVQRGVVEPGALERDLERTLSEAEDGLIDV